MKNHLCLLTIRFTQTNYQSFFCLLFFSKKRTVPTFLFECNQNKNGDEKSHMLAYYKICTKQITKASFAFFSSRRKERCLLFFSKKSRAAYYVVSGEVRNI